MRLRILFCLLLVILCSKLLMAQQHDEALVHSLLWRVSGNHLAKPSYLFGTVHIICQDDYLWTGKMKASLAGCDKVCLEIYSGDSLDKKKALVKMIADKKISEQFSPEDFAIVQRYCDDSLHKKLSPDLHISTEMVYMLMFKKLLGCPKTTSYERTITKWALKNGKPVTGLETDKDRALIDAKLPQDKYAKHIVAIAKNSNQIRTGFAKLVATYIQQDINQLYTAAHAEQTNLTNEVLLNERNKQWVERMPAMMDSASVFFAVGAGHLAGEQGLITLLRKAGYTVEPLTDTVNVVTHNEPQQETSAGQLIKPEPGFDLGNYLGTHMRYPAEAKKQQVEGKVYVRFEVGADGKISDCKVLKGIGAGCDEEAVRVIENMPAWQPATKDGTPIKYWYNQVISFKLQGHE